MHNEKTRILGVSLGTRHIGISLLQGTELIDWRVKVFRERWSPKKLATILRYFDKLLHFHKIEVVALKLPSLIKSSDGLQELITEARELFKQRKVEVYEYSIGDLKTYHFPHSRSNKKALIQCVAEKFPEVYLASKKEHSNRNPHYIKMFEAIGAAHLQCQRILQQQVRHTEGKAMHYYGRKHKK